MSQSAVEYLAETIIDYHPELTKMDKLYIQNKILTLCGDAALTIKIGSQTNISDIINQMTKNEKIKSQLYDLLTPIPSQVNQIFWQTYKEKGSIAATNYFYKLSQENDYLKVAEISKNVKFTTPSQYGDLEITINLSKPEKTTSEISAKKLTRNYPKCLLCFGNEGYIGTDSYPPRAQHRIIRLKLNNRTWGMQYSPYEYFDEHIIVIDEKHEPMNINEATFINLFDFVDLFPQYFLGSNAGLPIIGGSMLAHEHYQGGKHHFPVESATSCFSFDTGLDTVNASVLNWPVSTIKLTGKNKKDMIEYANRILEAWRNFTEPSLQISAYSQDETEHHSINPIVRKKNAEYSLYIMLRDNNTSNEYPEGIFHVHPEFQHIKKENIGLIETMGLAILPGRLKSELQEVANFIRNKPATVNPIHQKWAKKLKDSYTEDDDVYQYIDKSLGAVFTQILENTGTFKDITPDNIYLRRFINSI